MSAFSKLMKPHIYTN